MNALKSLLQCEQKYRNMPRDAAEILRIFAISDLNKKMERRMLICVKHLKTGQKKAETKAQKKTKLITTVGLLSLGKLSLEEISKVTKFSIERIKEIAVLKGLPYPVN